MCNRCGTKLGTATELVPLLDTYFICQPCEVKAIRNAAYLTLTGQSPELVEQKVPYSVVEKELKRRG